MKSVFTKKDSQQASQQLITYSPKESGKRQKLPPILSQSIKKKIIKALKSEINFSQKSDRFIENCIPQEIFTSNRKVKRRDRNVQYQIPRFLSTSQKKTKDTNAALKIQKMRVAHQPEEKISKQLEKLSDQSHCFKPFFTKGERWTFNQMREKQKNWKQENVAKSQEEEQLLDLNYCSAIKIRRRQRPFKEKNYSIRYQLIFYMQLACIFHQIKKHQNYQLGYNFQKETSNKHLKIQYFSMLIKLN